ncbi:MAG: phosphoglycerate kinase [Armatimonadota bacterium]
MDKRTIRDVDFAGKRVLVRVDFNVPLEQGRITDDTRIQSALPTIQSLVEEGARVVLCSHLGRPGGEPDSELSLQPAADRLGEMIGASVTMAPDCIGDEVAGMRAELGEGEILVLENTRFHPGEEANDSDFARQLAGDAELYVDDAFGSMHRAHASTVGVTDFIPDCVAGLLVEEELEKLEPCREASGDGFIVILGGAKVKDKIDAISQLLPRAERLLVGGAMAWAFLKARGLEIGESLCEDESLEAARQIEAEMTDLIERMILPVDAHLKQVEPDTGQTKYAPVTEIQPGWDGLDIGPESQSLFAEMVQDAEIVFWNGPMGYFEKKPFDEGTRAMAAALAETDAYTAVGGGDSVAAITEMGFEDDMTHISTGGGASLEFVQGDDLPGVEALDER